MMRFAFVEHEMTKGFGFIFEDGRAVVIYAPNDVECYDWNEYVIIEEFSSIDSAINAYVKFIS